MTVVITNKANLKKVTITHRKRTMVARIVVILPERIETPISLKDSYILSCLS